MCEQYANVRILVKRKMRVLSKMLLAISGEAYHSEKIMDHAGFLKALQLAVKRAGTQKQAAMVLGVSEQFLSDVLNRRRGPGEKLLAKLGLKQRTIFERIKQTA
jgi:hypothetical protein